MVASTTANNLTVAGSQLFFKRTASDSGSELWVSDGTDAGTHLVTDILPGPGGGLSAVYPTGAILPFGDRVLFLANDGVHGMELWISDGTAGGTRMVRDITPGPEGTWDNTGYSVLTIGTLGNRAFFSANDSQHGEELWVTDGTEAGTVLFDDINPGSGYSFPGSFVVAGDYLFFAASSDTAFNPQLWITDGSVAGTHAIGEAAGLSLDSSAYLAPLGAKVYFAGTSLVTGGEPWVTDGTDAGTRVIANLAADGPPSSSPTGLTATDNLVFFYADEGAAAATIHGYQSSLWRSDGTEAGTFKLRDSGQFPAPLQAAGPLVFFQNQIDDAQLIVSDGTVAGTTTANAFMSRFGPSRVGTLFPFGDTLFATVFDNLQPSDASLWKTTTAQNASAISLGDLNPFGLIEFGGGYVFCAGRNGYSLWRTDGTEPGTQVIIQGLNDNKQELSGLVNAAGTVFFLNQARGENPKLWKSDGTLAGTTVVKELPPGDLNFCEIKAAGRRVFFVIGSALWTSDGTGSGTIQVASVNFTPGPSDNLRPAGDRIAFAQNTESGGQISYELWGSDGTPAGTRLLQNLGQPSPQLVSIDGRVYFAGTDDVHGTEMWTTDGTVDGTKLLADVNPGPASSSPSGFTKVGNTIYFSAYTNATGGELWALPLPSSHRHIGPH